MSIEEVPLVIYKDGERKEIGVATVRTVGSFVEITESTVIHSEYEPLIHEAEGTFSILDTDDIILTKENKKEVAEVLGYTVDTCDEILRKAREQGFKGILQNPRGD